MKFSLGCFYFFIMAVTKTLVNKMDNAEMFWSHLYRAKVVNQSYPHYTLLRYYFLGFFCLD